MRVPRCVLEALIRRRYGRRIYETPFDRYKVRVARTAEDYRQAFRLLHIAYAYEGIEDVGPVAMRITPQHVLPESTIFIAYEGPHIVGTQTVTMDSAAGLPLERDYGPPIAALRAQGERVVEYGSLAVVRRCWHTGVTALLNMAAYWFATRHLAGTRCVVGVHPKIAAFYQALYRYEPLGDVQRHCQLTAPVQGLVQDMQRVRSWFARHFSGKSSASGLPMHLHFTELLPMCIELPPVRSLAELARWKLPRAVFRQLFIDESDRLVTLDPATRSQLASWRTLKTTGATPMASPAGRPVVDLHEQLSRIPRQSPTTPRPVTAKRQAQGAGN